MFTISKTFKFSAAHHLDHLPADHKCSRRHGHNYTVTVLLQAEDKLVLQAYDAWVRDYGELDPFKVFIDEYLDHRDLNEALTFDVTGLYDFKTTAEMIAYFLFLWCRAHWPETSSVRVSETDGTTAEYSERAA